MLPVTEIEENTWVELQKYLFL